MTNRSDLVQAIHQADRNQDGRALAQAVAALDAHDRQLRATAAADQELDLGARLAAERLTPVPLHEFHTAATDWLAEESGTRAADYRTAMVVEASTWYGGLDQAVRADADEFAEQARGRARTAASAHGYQFAAAQQEFLRTVGYLRSVDAASGLPQIDQTIDPNNNPSPTPYPAEVFPTFGEEQDEFNGVETNAHGSGATSERAPMLQQIQQQNGSGSGFGAGPEKPVEHDEGFDTSNSYAEVPLGAPGQIPTADGSQMAGSSPAPMAGQDQDAGSERRQVAAAIDGFSYPDPFGYRWPMTAEVMHPFHERCASAHWPDESCGDRAHTASVAIAYTMDLDTARRAAACERLGVQEGLRAIAAAGSIAELGAHHNRVASAWGATDRSADDTAVLHGFMAVVRPVLAEVAHEAGKVCGACRSGNCQNCAGDGCTCSKCHKNGKQGAKVAGYIGAMANEYHVEPAASGNQKAASLVSRLDFREGASALTQVQQITDPNNVPSPEDDQLPAGVMFPIGDGLAAQWVTGPGGAQPKGGGEGQQHEASGKRGLPRGAAQMWGHLDAQESKQPQHQSDWQYSPQTHGDYLRSYNNTAGIVHGMVGKAPMSKEEYSSATGRPDLHGHYLHAYAEGRKRNSSPQGPYGAEGLQSQGSQRTADAWSQPRQTTDDMNPPYNSAATTPPVSQDQGDYAAGKSAGQADRAAGSRPAFADNSSGVSPYVKGYAEGYGAPSAPQGAQDVPGSMGGDSGQAANAQEAQQAFQVARASRRTASLRRVSASFAPAALLNDAEFRKGYLFASKWKPGGRLVSQGSARFEAGVYAGITDQPASQKAWLAEHRRLAGKYPALERRIGLHASFTRKHARRTGQRAGVYLRSQAATSTDLITDGPGTSPDPMGSTPINGPGTPPPMAGMDNANAPGGSPPYQGAPPLPGGPVAPDDVMGKPQQAPQASGPFTNTFSGNHPGNADLAPVAPNSAAQPGYSNKDAYRGDPGGDRTARLAAFRAAVQDNLSRMGARQ